MHEILSRAKGILNSIPAGSVEDYIEYIKSLPLNPSAEALVLQNKLESVLNMVIATAFHKIFKNEIDEEKFHAVCRRLRYASGSAGLADYRADDHLATMKLTVANHTTLEVQYMLRRFDTKELGCQTLSRLDNGPGTTNDEDKDEDDLDAQGMFQNRKKVDKLNDLVLHHFLTQIKEQLQLKTYTNK